MKQQQLPIYGVLEEEEDPTADDQGIYEESPDYSDLTTIHLQPPMQPIYGVLENENREPTDIYESSDDYTRIDNNIQPIYGELEPDTVTENIYNQPEDEEQPVYREIEGKDEPDYKSVDEIYINNSAALSLKNNGDLATANGDIETSEKPKLAPKPKFIPPMSPPLRQKVSAGGQMRRSSDFDVNVS